MMDQPFISMIMIWAPDFAPQNWSFCAGQLIAISQNQALFSLIGTTYGGDGHTSFALPDLRGRAPTGVGHGPGLSPIQLGWHGGTNEVTLTQVNMPVHSHDAGTMSASTQAWDTPATDQNPSTGKGLAAANAPSGLSASAVRAYADPSGSAVDLAGGHIHGTTGMAGGSQPFGIMQPFLGLNFCIAMYGIYPSRS